MILKRQHWNIFSLMSRASSPTDGQTKRQIASGHEARVVAVSFSPAANNLEKRLSTKSGICLVE